MEPGERDGVWEDDILTSRSRSQRELVHRLPHSLNQDPVQSWHFRCVLFNMDIFWVIGPAGLETNLFSVLPPSKGT